MDAKLTSLTFLLLIGPFLFAQAPATPVTVRVRVHEPDGRPVEGATVTLGLPRYSQPRDEESHALTDKAGMATVTGVAQWDYSITVKKGGYYATTVPKRTIASDYEIKLYATGVQQFDLELKPIKNPIPMLGGGSGNGTLRLPSMTEPVGFDLEQDDWVAPWGRGKVGDFVFHVSGYARDRTDYDQTLTLRFSNRDDGIQRFSHPTDQQSEYVFPYEAPASGYQSQWTWRLQNNSDGTKRDYDDSVSYIFRIRTELNADGTVKRAMYGILPTGLIFAPGDQATGVKFSYLLNPTWTPNLEVDPKHSVHADPH